MTLEHDLRCFKDIKPHYKQEPCWVQSDWLMGLHRGGSRIWLRIRMCECWLSCRPCIRDYNMCIHSTVTGQTADTLTGMAPRMRAVKYAITPSIAHKHTHILIASHARLLNFYFECIQLSFNIYSFVV